MVTSTVITHTTPDGRMLTTTVGIGMPGAIGIATKMLDTTAYDGLTPGIYSRRLSISIFHTFCNFQFDCTLGLFVSYINIWYTISYATDFNQARDF